MGTRLGLLVGAAGALAIACGADSELAAGAMQHAGDAMVDAGKALVDAGSAMVGADVDGSASAQADAAVPAQTRRTLVSTCDQVRAYTVESGTGPQPREQRFARFAVGLEAVRSVWMCDDRSYVADKCPAATCTGAAIAKPECVLGAPTWTGEGAVWVSCGQAATVRVVVD